MSEHARVYDYFYTRDLEIMNFYMIPKVLVKDKYFAELSNDAKMMYALLLDRTHLSDKNGWADSGGQLYIIYTTEELMDDLNVSKRTVIKLMAELDSEKGYGLIERVKQGFGLPNRIYVKNVTKIQAENDRKCTHQNRPGEGVQNLHEYGLKTAPDEVQNLHPNYTDINNTDINNTNKYTLRSSVKGMDDRCMSSNGLHPSIHPSLNFNSIGELEESVKQQIGFDYLVSDPANANLADGILNLIVETLAMPKDTLINDQPVSAEFLKYRFSKLRKEHVEQVIEVMKEQTEKIANVRNYLLSLLFNSVTSMDAWYQNKVNHDMRR